MNKKLTGSIAGLAAVVASTAGIFGTASAAESEAKYAEAEINANPNPATAGQVVTLTGNCGAGKEIKHIGNMPGVDYPFTKVVVVNDDPAGFVAKATVEEGLGYGGGPIFVDCGVDGVTTTLKVQPAN